MSTSLFHVLEGKNICFKALNINDVQEIHNYASDENVSRFIGWKLMKTLDETHNHIEEMMKRESAGTHLYSSIALKLTQEVIGTAMIFNFDHEAKNAEIGYVFHSSHWGKGWGFAAAHLVIGMLFCITIIGIPIGLQHFKFAKLGLIPFGAKISNLRIDMSCG